jgi:hypothetical protein
LGFFAVLVAVLVPVELELEPEPLLSKPLIEAALGRDAPRRSEWRLLSERIYARSGERLAETCPRDRAWRLERIQRTERTERIERIERIERTERSKDEKRRIRKIEQLLK